MVHFVRHEDTKFYCFGWKGRYFERIRNEFAHVVVRRVLPLLGCGDDDPHFIALFLRAIDIVILLEQNPESAFC